MRTAVLIFIIISTRVVFQVKFEKMIDGVCSNSQPRLGTRKSNDGRKFSELKVQEVSNKLEFGKITRKDILCTKM